MGATGWCITAMQYFEGIQEMKSGPFGGFHRRRCITGLWVANYTVTLTEEEDSEDDTIITEKTVQGTVNIYREFMINQIVENTILKLS